MNEHNYTSHMVVHVKACRILVQQCTARAGSNQCVDERIRYGMRQLLQHIAPGYEALDRRVKQDFEIYLDQEAQKRTVRIAKGKEARDERERLQVQSVSARRITGCPGAMGPAVLVAYNASKPCAEHECTAGDVVCGGGMCTTHGYAVHACTLVALPCMICTPPCCAGDKGDTFGDQLETD